MYMTKWWHLLSNPELCSQWFIPDKWVSTAPLSTLPNSQGCLAREGAAAKWQVPNTQITVGKTQWKHVWLMMVETLTARGRQSSAPEMGGWSGSPRNSKCLLHNWALATTLWRTRTKNLGHLQHLQYTFQIIFQTWLPVTLKKKREGEAVTIEIGNNLAAIRNPEQVILSYCTFREFGIKGTLVYDWMMTESQNHSESLRMVKTS